MLLAYLKIRWKILSLVGLLSALVAVVATRGIASMVIYQERIARQNEADARALYAEHVNSLIYAVVMDSRGVYMSDSTAAGQRFGQGGLGLSQADARDDGCLAPRRPGR